MNKNRIKNILFSSNNCLKKFVLQKFIKKMTALNKKFKIFKLEKYQK